MTDKELLLNRINLKKKCYANKIKALDVLEQFVKDLPSTLTNQKVLEALYLLG